MISNLVADVRYSLRGFARQPLFAVVIVLTLAFGVGANVAIFSVFEQLLLRPLPVSEPQRLVNLGAPEEAPTAQMGVCNRAGPCSALFNYPMFRDLEKAQEPFTGIAAHRVIRADVALDGQAVTGSGATVSGSYFPLLGIAPAVGRLLGPQDDAVEGGADSAVLSYAYWQSAFGGDPSVVGRTILVNGKPLIVVGVAPRGFHGATVGARPNVYVPISFRWSTQDATPNFTDRRAYWLYLFARLKPGVSQTEANASINLAHRAIVDGVEAPLITDASAEDLERFRARPIELTPGARGQSMTPARVRTPLAIMLATTTVVLLIACANIASLMLARGTSRVGEMAIRASLGAERGRLAGLLLTESVLLALLAAAVSLPVALGTLHGLAALLPSAQTEGVDLELTLSSVATAGIVATASALLFGLFPALKLARTHPARELQANGTRSTGGKAVAGFRAALATAQIALSMALLVTAGLFTRSLVNVASVDVGIEIGSVATFSLAPELVGYTNERTAALFDRLQDELGATPGVTAVATSGSGVLSDNYWRTDVSIEPGSWSLVEANWVGDAFLRVLDVPLLAGRDFARGDASGRPKVAIVNQRFVEHFGLGRNAVGTRFGMDSEGPHDIEIVGVIPDARFSNPKQTTFPYILLPHRQSDQPETAANFYVRGVGDPERLITVIRQLVARLDPNLPVTRLQTVERQARDTIFEDRFLAMLSVGLAVLATLLAALGLYGLLSYVVSQRTREIGLRLALGALPAKLRGMVMGQVVRMGLIGGAIGLGAALLLGRAAASLLFGVDFADPAVLLAAGAALIAVVLAAGYWPARRASLVDPVVALRSE